MSSKLIHIKIEVHDRVKEIFPAKSFSKSITILLDEHELLLKLTERERILKKFKITDVTSEQIEILKEMDKISHEGSMSPL